MVFPTEHVAASHHIFPHLHPKLNKSLKLPLLCTYPCHPLCTPLTMEATKEMAAAVLAYGSVLSLMRALDNALLPRPLPKRSEIKTLQEKVRRLQESLELLHPSATDGTKISQIREAVREADDLVDNYVVDQLSGAEPEEDERYKSLFSEEARALTQRIVSLNQDLMATATMDKDPQPRENPPHGRASRADKKTTMWGFEQLFTKIKGDLTDGGNLSRGIFHITGIGGSGKTTLAQNIYNHVDVVEHFELRLWLAISQEFDVREIFLGLQRDGFIHGDVGDLDLYKALSGRRYLIVMDDVWSTKAWDQLKFYFPEDENGSRILITTRMKSVASFATKSYKTNLLDEENCWRLFCGKVFGETYPCPSDLEEIGKKIVRKCNGLPLAVSVVAATLSNIRPNLIFWKLFAEKMDTDLHLHMHKNLTEILSLSYNHLPIHLKLCFVSMVEFPKGSRIEASRLVELWVATGIVKPTGDERNVEEAAVEYLEDLIGRNMVMEVERGSLGNIKACAINDVLRQIGLRESQGESFLHAPKVQEISYSSLRSKNPCFLCCKNGAEKKFQLHKVLVGSPSTVPLNPTVCDDCAAKHPHLDGSRSVTLIERVQDRRVEVPQTTKLRSLSIGDQFRFYSKEIVFASPSTVPLLWNLQRLCFHVSGQEVTMLLSKIWEMPQLRYLHLLRHALPDPEDRRHPAILLQQLRTLKLVKNLRFTNDVVRRIPNLVRLSVLYDPEAKEGEELNCSYYHLHGLELLRSLRVLKLSCRRRSFDIRDIPVLMSLKSISFPSSLRKLTLMDCKLCWDDVSVIGWLPNLEVLKLKRDAVVGEKWCTGEGEFEKLKYLKLEDLDLVSWTVEGDSSAFRRLTKLVLFGLYQLVEIPLLLGGLGSMEAIHASFCTQYVVEKVKKIKEEQELFSNESFCCVIEEE